MNELGLNIDQYSNMVDIPKKIIKKMINGNGEVVKDMEINNFLRKNMFNKHQEIENNKEEKKVEALKLKTEIVKNSRNVNNINEELLNWYNNFDFKKFIKENKLTIKEVSDGTGIPRGSISYTINKISIPTENRILKLKKFVESFKITITPDERTAIVSEESIMKPFESVTVTGTAKVFDIPANNEDIMKLDNEEILRNLLKDRLTEEEKTLIRIFGGKI